MRFLLVLTLLCFSLSAAHAAKKVRVGQDTFVYSQPSDESEALNSVSAGTVVPVSNKSREGWFKTRTTEGKFGWIRGKDLVLSSSRDFKLSATQRHKVERQEVRHRWVITPTYSLSYVRPSSLQSVSLATSRFVPAHGFGMELGYRPTTSWTVLLRGDYLLLNQSFTATDGSAGSYSAAGINALLIVDYALVHSLPFKLDFGLGGGISVGNRITSQVGTSTASGTASLAPVALARLDGKFYLGQNVAFVLGLGYRYLTQNSVSLTGAAGTAVINSVLNGPYSRAAFSIEF